MRHYSCKSESDVRCFSPAQLAVLKLSVWEWRCSLSLHLSKQCSLVPIFFFFFILYSASGSLKKVERGSLASSFNISLTDSIKKKKQPNNNCLSVHHQGPETSWQCHCLLALLTLSVFPELFPSPQSAFQACRFRKCCLESEQLRSFLACSWPSLKSCVQDPAKPKLADGWKLL